MAYLLDTNVVIKSTDDPDFFGPFTIDILENEPTYISTISFLEIKIKTMLGKLTLAMPTTELLDSLSSKVLDLKLEHTEALAQFPLLVRHDPFDRILLAQAKAENLTLLTADETLLSLGLDFVRDSRL
jgi:PIN domain nuclease of toxin-antitoxin system